MKLIASYFNNCLSSKQRKLHTYHKDSCFLCNETTNVKDVKFMVFDLQCIAIMQGFTLLCALWCLWAPAFTKFKSTSIQFNCNPL